MFKGLVYTVYKGAHSNTLYSAWFDGTTWYGNTKISDQPGGISPESDDNPTLIVFKDKLYVIYKGAYFDTLYCAWFDGTTWYGNIKIEDMPGGISPKSDDTPGAALYRDCLVLIYRGSWTFDIYFASFDGETWSGNVKVREQAGGINPRSGQSPNLDVYNDKLYLMYKGADTGALYSAWFDGRQWYGDTKISAQPGHISPASDYTPGVAVTTTLPSNMSGWMKNLPDALSIAEINLPGSHDAAAISFGKEPYACHNTSITDQLNYGIRVLDVRLKVIENGSNYKFITCHGDIRLDDENEYQSFPSLLDECRLFLKTNPSETVIMSLKVDDWNNTKNKSQALASLTLLVNTYPVTAQASLPNLGSIRSKIFLYNRENDDLALGVPIRIPFNTSGSYVAPSGNRSYPVYVQDKFKELPHYNPEEEKYDLVIKAMSQKLPGQVVLNFASATWWGLYGVYIMGQFLDYFGSKPVTARPVTFGWTLFDYAFDFYHTNTYSALNVVSLIISSNFNYAGYEKPFRVIRNGHDEL